MTACQPTDAMTPTPAQLDAHEPSDHRLASTPQVQALVSFLEHEAQPMMVLDPQYRILAANTAYRRQFAPAGRPFAGRQCFRVSHDFDAPCDHSGEHCPMKQALESKRPDRVLHVHHTPRGPEHVDVELRPILDDRDEVVAFVERIVTVRHASAQANASGLVGRSPAFSKALSAVQRVARSSLPVLLLGESGSGKELFARAVHETSQRADGPFVVVDCSGFSETLFESELFGYERGAFTGANARKPGLVETASGGTLFLDEIGDVPFAMQVKLLRLIETGTYRRVGSVEMHKADFRLVAATHKPLLEMIEDGRFRQDLYYRISAFPIHLPALRERADDIPLLAQSFLQRASDAPSRMRIDDRAMKLLRSHDWPGNIRELRNVLDRAGLFADDGVIRPEHLPEQLQHGRVPSTVAMDDEEARLRRLATQSGLTRREIAARLGMSERTLYRRLKDCGLL
jgi:transcriptional regulator with PAS, ATPase and Fis domain